MNAYELADELENKLNLSENLFVFDAADMLRQQADTIYKHMELITELRKECNARADRIAELEKENKQQKCKIGSLQRLLAQSEIELDGLYENLSHPVKQLSDEEIFAISNTMPYANRFEFARAIIKEITE